MPVMRVNVVIKMKNAERLFIRKITSPKKKYALKEYFKGTPHRTLIAVTVKYSRGDYRYYCKAFFKLKR
jgi:hypothetical protein